MSKVVTIVLFICALTEVAYSQRQQPDVLFILLDFKSCPTCRDLGLLDSLFRQQKSIFSKPEEPPILLSPRLSSIMSKYKFMISGTVKRVGQNCSIEYVFKDKMGNLLPLPARKFATQVSNTDQWKAWVTNIISDIDYFRRNSKFKDRVGVNPFECTGITDEDCKFRAITTFSTMVDDMNSHEWFKTVFTFEAISGHKHQMATFVRRDSIIVSLAIPKQNPAGGKAYFKCNKPNDTKQALLLALWKSYVDPRR